MPVLKNPRHEKFAQAVVAGKNNGDAYHDAYGKSDRKAASRLRQREDVSRRIEFLLGQVADIHEEATSKAIAVVVERYAITKERVLSELAKMAFANMMDYIRVGPDGLPYCDFSALDRDMGVAIQEVNVETSMISEVGEDGERRGVQVRKARFKLADKRAALVDLGKHLQLFREQVDVKVSHDDVSADALRARILEQIDELGLVPANLGLPAPVTDGVANRPRKTEH